MPTVEELKSSLDDSLKERADAEKEIRSTLSKQAEEVQKFGQTTKETAEKLAAAETKWDDHGKRIDEVKKELFAEVEKHAARVDELEKKAQRPGWQGVEAEIRESIGAQFAKLLEESGEVGRRNVLEGRGDFGPNLVLKSFDGAPAFGGPFAEVRKAVGSADVPVPPTYEPGYLAIPRRRLRMRDLMTVVRTTAPKITYLEEVGFMAVTQLAVTSITRSGQVATVTTTAAHGLRTFDRVRVSGAVQTEYNVDARITFTSATTFTYPVAGSPATPATTATAITVQRLNNFGAAAFVAEGAIKPESTMSRKEVQIAMEVVAHVMHLARQILDDLPGLRAEIDNAGIYGLLRREEDALLYGSGVSPQIQGILTHPNVQNYLWSSGPVGSGDKRVDAIRRAVTRVEIADLEATGAVVGPLAWEDIELTKGSDGHYIWVEAPGTGGESRVWRLPLVVTNAIDTDDFLVGAFGTAATLYDREQANVRFSDSHDQNFIRNLVTLLFEERIGAAWKRPEAFVHGVFDAAPAES